MSGKEKKNNKQAKSKKLGAEKRSYYSELDKFIAIGRPTFS
jgi:hypothetical protein